CLSPPSCDFCPFSLTLYSGLLAQSTVEAKGDLRGRDDRAPRRSLIDQGRFGLSRPALFCLAGKI
ncbi:MAG: hypothetical protein ACK4I8_10095, partial [Armatimonadota bacterium]